MSPPHADPSNEASATMPKLPGEKVLLHQATQILEDAVGYLSSHGDLMRFASEGTTRKMEVIIDPPLPASLPEGHAQYFRMEHEAGRLGWRRTGMKGGEPG